MFFKDYFLSIADCLDSKFKGYKYDEQNPADRGELSEIFIKEFLTESLSSNLKIFRGGKIVNIDNTLSAQLDILACANNTITIFKDKGIYPIETVCGVFSVTATLTKQKLYDCIKEFKSIPKENPQFNYFGTINEQTNTEKWKNIFPFKCVWAYSGNISFEWEKILNELVENDPGVKKYLPDLIVVNKIGMIMKTEPESEFNDGKKVGKNFHYIDFVSAAKGQYWISFEHVLSKLYQFSNWQHFVTPNYEAYFNKDIETLND
jgi:hypothetical protein